MSASISLGAALAPAAPTEERHLPPLRNDIQIQPAAPGEGGVRQWCLFDPMRGVYFLTSEMAVALLANWQAGTASRIAAAAGTELRPAGVEHVEQLYRFLLANDLLEGGGRDQRAAYRRRKAAHREGPLTWLMHRYLFFRIPLIRPDRLLTRATPVVMPLFSGTMVAVCFLLGIAGIYLLGRQWDEFTRTVGGLLNVKGALGLGLALAVTKPLHELGHAFMAKRFGCRVHSMGVAFLVMMPMLYTDVTDTWRLTSRRQRLLVGAGGMLVELCLASVATFLWSFLPDGTLRQAVFLVAAVTWLTTLAINANPFMRFDGYYIFADFFRVENLRVRAFAYCRWALREVLFGFGEPAPEPASAARRRLFYAWGYAAWLWRLFLFLGIAYLVYHLFPKAIGIVLGSVEVGWFLVLPVALEVHENWKRRGRMTLNRRSVTTGAVLLVLLALFIVPWRSDVAVPVALEAENEALLYTAGAAQLLDSPPTPDSAVKAGDVLFRLRSPDLEYRLQQAERRIALVSLQLERSAVDDLTVDIVQTLRQRLEGNIAEARGFRHQIEKLVVTAPFDGVLRDMPEGLQQGRWLPASAVLGRIVDARAARFVGYVSETTLARIAPGNGGHFVSDDGLAATIDVTVASIERSAAATIDQRALTAPYGGPIATRPDGRGRMVPDVAQYRVVLTPAGGMAAPNRTATGIVLVNGQARSFATDLWRSTVAVLIRESGF